MRVGRIVMTKKESKLLYFFFTMLLITGLFRGIPLGIRYYHQGLNDIELLQSKAERLDKLQSKQQFWADEYAKIKKLEENRVKQLFSAKSRELVAAKLQTLVKKIAINSGAKIQSSRLPEFKDNAQWLMITQNMSISGDMSSIMAFVNALEHSQKKLIISQMKIRSSRRILRGSLSVTAFSQKNTKVDDL